MTPLFSRLSKSMIIATLALTAPCIGGCHMSRAKSKMAELPQPLSESPTTASNVTPDVTHSNAEASSSSGPVLKVSGVRPQAGPIRTAIFTATEGFPNHDQSASKLAFDSSSAVVQGSLGELASGTFALAVYQDLNNDGQLNRSPIGMPTEPYGFSRNARGQFGPPTFSDAMLEGVSDGATIEVSLQ